MSWQQQNSSGPRMTATFSPGLDDFHMPAPPPDVISPAPQRITPEVPSNIQDSLAHLELDGKPIEPRSPPQAQYAPNSRPQQTPNTPSVGPRPVDSDEPNYSPFPKLRSRPPNVPQSLEERELMLETAREQVLRASDPEMQLEWAQDTLQYIDVCVEQRQRLAIVQTTPTPIPTVQQQLQQDAVNIVMFLADQHHPRAEFMKGMWLEFGKFGFAQDKPEAFRAYKRAASNGYARAEYRMGVQFESTGESIKALQHYKAGETLGDSASCYRMGMMCLTGQLGQTQDFYNAIRLIKQAANTADSNAPQGAYVLGMLLARELSEIKVPDDILPADLAGAKVFIEKAAFLGFAKAQLKMGTAYEMCMMGCEFDPVMSVHYSLLAAQQGEPDAEMSVSKWLLCGHEGVFRKNEELAFKYAQRAASSSLPTAQFAMGYFYEIGIHVQRNMSLAVEWYEKAAQNDNKDARGRLEAISKSRTMSRTDHENVTVTRIQSQYGSRRGERPQRFQNNPNPMPTIQDSEPPGAPSYQQPPVAGRVTPYPVNDRPIFSTPYPVDDPYAVKPRPTLTASSGPAAAQRQYSAAGNARYDQQGRPPQSGPMLNPQAQYRPMQPDRPNPVPGNTNPNPNYRPGPGPGPGQGPRPTPGPGGRPPAQGGPQQYNQGPMPQSGRPPEDRPPPQRVDIGFSAPIDTRADQRNRPQTNLHPPPNRTYGNNRTGSGQPQQANLAPAHQAQQRPSSAASAPRPANTSGPPSELKMSGALPNPTAPRPSAAPSQAPAKPSSTPAPAKPPGPQTFQEMGVPASKKDHDCIVM